jgi:transposase
MLEYDLRRVDCPWCGVTTELVPWADPESKFTYAFEQQTAYLAQKCDKTSVSTAMRIAWYTVGTIVERVVKRLRNKDPLTGLTHIGVDELSYRKHHEYLTVVVNLLTSEVVWAHPGKNADTLAKFFEELGPERREAIELVAIDMSAAYTKAIKAAVPKAKLVFDRFHVQRLVHDALDKVRREEVAAAGGSSHGHALKKTRWPLQKNPWNLTLIESAKLSFLQRANKPIYRAYLLKESLAAILDGRQVNVARDKLGEWIAWALRSRLPPFSKAARTIREHLEGILAYVQTRFSNGRTEGLNGKIRTITRRAFGFHRPESLIALIFLCCSGIALNPAHANPLPLIG